MKKLILGIFCMACVGASAQQLEIGGTVNFTSAKLTQGSSEAKATNFSLLPSLMYHMNENWAVGAQFGIDYEKEGDEKTTVFQIAPTVRYTQNIAGNFSWAPQMMVGLGFGTAEWSTVDITGDLDVTRFTAALSVARFEYGLSDNFGVSLDFGGIAYASEKQSIPGYSTLYSEKTTGFGVSLMQGVGVGIVYKF